MGLVYCVFKVTHLKQSLNEALSEWMENNFTYFVKVFDEKKHIRKATYSP